MALKIVTGGTTDAADGTLVSSGNKPVFTAVDGALDLHVRCDDDTYSTDSTITLPSDGGIEISFDGGSVWKAYADNPIPILTGIGLGGTDVGDLNFPIKMRQHASTSTVSGQFTSDGTFSAATALADVTSFAVTPGGSQNAVSWAAVTNRTRYQVDRATNSGFTTGVSLGVYTGTSTSFTDTGLTNGTTYYYRIKAVGTYRYKDSASFATANGTPTTTTVTYAPAHDVAIRYYDGTGSWSSIRSAATGTDVYTTSDPTSGVYSDASLPLIIRGFLTFDTSALPDGATIVSAKLKLYGSSVVGTIGTVDVVAGTPADPTSYATADFDQAGSALLSDTQIAISSWSTAGYNEFPLNSTGLAAISKTGYTVLALRHSSDRSNSSPASPAAASYYPVEHAGTDHDPILEVIYG